MSDPDTNVRLMSTHCFATLIRLLPLEGGIPDPPSLSKDMLERKRKEREFLEKLLDPTKIENYKVPVPIYAELRSYQQVSTLVMLGGHLADWRAIDSFKLCQETNYFSVSNEVLFRDISERNQ